MAGTEWPALSDHAAARMVSQQPMPHRRMIPLKVTPRPQSRLHNFSFPSMSWGSQSLFRCMKVDPRGVSADRVPMPEIGSLEGPRMEASRPTRRRGGAEEVGGGGDGKGEAEDDRLRKFKEANVAEFQKTADEIHLPHASGLGREERKGDLGPSPSPAGEEASRPWNLRMTRADAPSTSLEKGIQKTKTQDQSQSSTASEKGLVASRFSGRKRRWEAGPEKEERPRFTPALSKGEIEEDFLLMTGAMPPRRPKKRPRNVQKQIDALCPGFYLTEITPNLYKIA